MKGIERLLKSVLLDTGERLERQFQNNQFCNSRDKNAIEFENEIEKFIINYITKVYPDHSIISEGLGYKEILKKKYIWCIDPIDGTQNFNKGIPFYSISIAVIRSQKVFLGGVYAPSLKSFYFAKENSNAFLNNRQIYVSMENELSKSIILSSSIESYRSTNSLEVFYNLLSKIKTLRITRCSSLDLCYIAQGAAEGRVYANTKIWDNAAGKFILKQAGGNTIDWNGSTPDCQSKHLIASNGRIENELANVLWKK